MNYSVNMETDWGGVWNGSLCVNVRKCISTERSAIDRCIKSETMGEMDKERERKEREGE